MEILDSGKRRQFYDKDGNEMGVRDIAVGKGRCDLLALDCVGDFFGSLARPEWNPFCWRADACCMILKCLNDVVRGTDEKAIAKCISHFVKVAFDDKPGYAMMELAKHYEEGAKKYTENNWRKGIPCHCYIDSCVRHLLKWYDGWDDEPHDRAVLWNLFGLWWTLKNKPECNDLPYTKEKADEDTT